MGLSLSLLGWVWIGVLVIAMVIMFLCVCCDTSEGLVADFFDLLLFELPAFVLDCLARCCGRNAAGRIARTVDSSVTWLCYTRNPIMQGVYLSVVLGAYSVAIVFAYPRVPATLLPWWHKVTAAVFVTVCLYLWWLACTVSPGIITEDTVQRFANYEYDDVLYRRGRKCRTTGLPKLPRSKFCRYMQANVARFDHFCPWLNQAVGQENYRYFLLFLCAHVALLAYGAFCLGAILLSYVYDKNLFDAHFYSPKEQRVVQASWRVILQYVMFNNWALFGVFVLCSVMAIVLACFTGYHLWLAAQNLTTNESYKWGDVKRHYRKRTKEGAKGEPSDNSSATAEADGEVAAQGEDEFGHLPDEMPGHLYDLGLYRNLAEVAFPLSLYAPPTGDPNKGGGNKRDQKKKKKKSGKGKKAD